MCRECMVPHVPSLLRLPSPPSFRPLQAPVGDIGDGIRNVLQQDAHFAGTNIDSDTAQHQTEPQMLAQVRGFFK